MIPFNTTRRTESIVVKESGRYPIFFRSYNCMIRNIYIISEEPTKTQIEIYDRRYGEKRTLAKYNDEIHLPYEVININHNYLAKEVIYLNIKTKKPIWVGVEYERR